jgi:hypothetical protein
MRVSRNQGLIRIESRVPVCYDFSAMPANLSPEFKKAEEELRVATNSQEKILALELMMATIPKHKGTEKMQADIKRRLSKLRNTEEKAAGKRGDALHVRKEGAAQAPIVGPPNSGKSSLIKVLSGADVEVAAYPFTTIRPFPYMMPMEDIQIQLVDTGPVAEDRLEPYHVNLLRNADLALLVMDLGADAPVGEFRAMLDTVARAKVDFVRDFDGEAPEYGVKPKRTIVVVNKYDQDEDDVLLDEVRAALGERFELIPVSCTTGHNIEALRHLIFERARILRVYSKIPGKPPDMAKPFVAPIGSTVLDVARLVHKEFADNLRYARIWGSERFDGQKVQRDYVVHDKDIIELHI